MKTNPHPAVNSKASMARTFVNILQKIETGILIFLSLSMILMAVFQIILRNFFDTGLLWGDPFIRLLVLWIGLIGAMVASRDNQHISIDLISKYLPPHIQIFSTSIISIFTTVTCGVMVFFSFSFVMIEKSDGMTAFGQVPVWICESIIPIAFSFITIRYLIHSITGIGQIFRYFKQ